MTPEADPRASAPSHGMESASPNLTAARIRLTLRGFREGWSIFVESRIGVIGLSVIIIFALMAISHPILMATIWDEATYDPVTGYAFDQTEQPAPPSWAHPCWAPTHWGGTC